LKSTNPASVPTRSFASQYRILERDVFLAHACENLFSVLNDNDESCQPTWWFRYCQAHGQSAADAGAVVRPWMMAVKIASPSPSRSRYLLRHPSPSNRTRELQSHLASLGLRVTSKEVRRFCAHHGIRRDMRAARPRTIPDVKRRRRNATWLARTPADRR
jgi:hypothetical protein